MGVTTQKPKYRELAEYLRERIRTGDLKVGERLPSYTELYDERGASTATVQRACDLLDQEHLIERRHGSGIFVAAPPRSVLRGTIGIIGSKGFKVEDSAFNVALMRAVHQAAESEGRQLLYLGQETSRYLRPETQVDGVLICGVEETATVIEQLPPDLPRVSVLTSMEGVTSVGVDEYRGAQMAVRHLIGMGHRRIACLMEKQAWEARRRVAGYRDALLESGIDPDPSWERLVISVDRHETQPYRDWAHAQMQAWLSDGWYETGCTAILAQNDMTALAVVQVLQKEGIKVPEKISVMGFDGTELCNLITPHLSAVAFPLTQIGARAMDMLNRQIAGEPCTAETILLPLSLQHGDSVAPVAVA
jgi:DNA-binding LacI/PurR family transcriptional regulator